MDIRVNSSKAQAALNRALTLGGAINSLLALVVQQFQREVRHNIETQGKDYGRWAPASKWIIAKEGRSKLFPEVSERIRVRNAPGRSEVVFDSPGAWTLTQHQQGFVIAPTGTLVTLDLKNPAALGVKGDKFKFISRRPSKIPPRRMWPTDTGAKRTAEPIVERWAKAVEASLT